MSMNVKLEKIDGEIYIVHEWLEYTEPFKQVLKWKVEGQAFRIPEESIGIALVMRPYGATQGVRVPIYPFSGIDLYIGVDQKADIVERLPVAQPKVRAGMRVKWDNGWKKETKREGWIAA